MQGKNIVVDRYAFSGVAFSATKGIDIEWCKNPDVGLPAPDVVIFLDLPIEDAMKRGQFGDERYEKKDFQVKVREMFHSLKDPSWKIVDARKSMDEVEMDVRSIALETIKRVHGQHDQSIQKLWVKK